MRYLWVFIATGWIGTFPVGDSPSVEGRWQACFKVTYYAKPACGTVEVGKGQPLSPDAPIAAMRHRVIHTVPFGDIAYSLTDLSRYGVLTTSPDTLHWRLQLGLRDSTLDFAADDGSIVADVSMAGDSIVGQWARTSWGPSHRGTVVLRR
jgi:hypothetical protein